MEEPIKSQQEAKRIRENTIIMTVLALGITEKAAELRIDALIKSGILDKYGPPESTIFQFAVDIAMRIPQIGIE